MERTGIVIFGGTTEGRLLVEAFCGTELELYVCVATQYGASCLPRGENVHIYAGRMDETGMEQFLDKTVPGCCLDATHPYALEVTENIYVSCARKRVPYLRVLRGEGEYGGRGQDIRKENDSGQLIYRQSIEDAVAYLNGVDGNILITTGSRDLEKYMRLVDYKKRCFARVLPTASVIEKCGELGFEGKNLIGMQGPFGEELNYAMLKQLKIVWMVTKNSGKEGGYSEKCAAACRAGVNLLVVGRPPQREENAMSLQEAIAYISEKYQVASKIGREEAGGKRKVFLIGMGVGNPACLTIEAKRRLEDCDVIIGAKRMLEIVREYTDKPFYQSYQKEEISAFLETHLEYKNAAVVYSGDIGFFSGAKGMRELLAGYEVHSVSGISSGIYFLNCLGIAWEEVRFASAHGQEINLVSLLRHNDKVCVLAGGKWDVAVMSRKLRECGMDGVRITVGERLSYPEESIRSGSPAQWEGKETDALAVILVEHMGKTLYPGIGDDAFIQGKVPMTKEEVRILTLAKLRLEEDSVLYDIGAGTGSISIEAALLAGRGKVYAIERRTEGVELIRKNCNRFQVDNVVVIEGEAPECLMEMEDREDEERWPAPTHAFVGGSGGRLLEIMHTLQRKNKNLRFVINVITLETMAEVMHIPSEFPEYKDMEVVQVNIAKGNKIGDYHLMRAENPVYIISFGGKGEES